MGFSGTYPAGRVPCRGRGSRLNTLTGAFALDASVWVNTTRATGMDEDEQSRAGPSWRLLPIGEAVRLRSVRSGTDAPPVGLLARRGQAHMGFDVIAVIRRGGHDLSQQLL